VAEDFEEDVFEEDGDEELELEDDIELDDIDATEEDDDEEEIAADDDEIDDDEEVEEELAVDDGDDEEDEESLDVLLARDPDEELVRLDEEPRDGLATVPPTIAADEFTCQSCFLVKRRAQLADEKKMICRDCA